MEELDGDSDSAALRHHLWLNRTERRWDANLSSGETETARLKKKKEKGSCHPVSRQVEIRLLVFFVFSVFKELVQERQEKEEGEKEEGKFKEKKKLALVVSLAGVHLIFISFLFHLFIFFGEMLSHLL